MLGAIPSPCQSSLFRILIGHCLIMNTTEKASLFFHFDKQALLVRSEESCMIIYGLPHGDKIIPTVHTPPPCRSISHDSWFQSSWNVTQTFGRVTQRTGHMTSITITWWILLQPRLQELPNDYLNLKFLRFESGKRFKNIDRVSNVYSPSLHSTYRLAKILAWSGSHKVDITW